MMAVFASRDVFFEAHELLAKETLERRTEQATALLAAHIASTLAHVYPKAGEQPS